MKPVRVQSAAVAGVVVTLLSAFAITLLHNSARALPQHSWWEPVLVIALIGALLASGWRVRVYVRSRTAANRDVAAARRAGDDEKAAALAAEQALVEAPGPERARRTLVFAQAGAVGGAVMAGWYLGQLVVHAQRLEVGSAQRAAVLLLVLTVAAVVLSVAGFLVQRWCTLPEDQR